jgi:hypothetical protein
MMKLFYEIDTTTGKCAIATVTSAGSNVTVQASEEVNTSSHNELKLS